MLFWGLLTIASLSIGKAPALTVICLFALIGFAVGVLQSLAVHSSPDAFLATKTSTDVKRALLLSFFGKSSFAVHWISLPALFYLVWFYNELALIQIIVGSYSSLLFARELASFPGVLFLARRRNRP
jgi:hypothetical protein